MIRTACLLLFATGLAFPAGAVTVANPSFEEDQYGTSPGYAHANGGITGWTYTGNVGINPVWSDPVGQTGPATPFLDNGVIPDGLQTALLQNECTLSQVLSGFEVDKHYVLYFHENARFLKQIPGNPRLVVRLGGQVIVVEHDVLNVDPSGVKATPYPEITSSVFTAPASGSFELEFETTVGGGVTVFVDHVRVEEVADPDSVTPTYGGAGGITVVNPGFEVDSFGTWPGYASANGGAITGWTTSGTGVGLNPVWDDPVAKTGPDQPFADNGVIPEGRQVLLMQNVATVSQALSGFEAGKRYQVRLWVNGRFNQGTAWPEFLVTLGGETIVSRNELAAVQGRDLRTLPYVEVLSAPFTAPADGSYVLAIETVEGGGVTLLVDDVSVVELPDNLAPEWSSGEVRLPDATAGLPYAAAIVPGAGNDIVDPEGDALAFRVVQGSWSGPAGSSDWLALQEDGAASNMRPVGVGDVGEHAWSVKADDGNGNKPAATLRVNVVTGSSVGSGWLLFE